jgi:uncharacterized protein
MKPALAIFAKTPRPGQVKTRLTPPLSPQQGADLYRCMLLDTATRVATLGIDTFIFYDGDKSFFTEQLAGFQLLPQQGDDLGTRLERAFTVLESLGYRARAVIGSDAPDLPLGYILESFRLMENGSDAVFGPAEDGGYYLVALRGSYGSLFKDVPWSGPDVLGTSLLRASDSGLTAALLPAWYDVDGYDDLLRPGISDPANGAPLTHDFLRNLGIIPRCAAADTSV